MVRQSRMTLKNLFKGSIYTTYKTQITARNAPCRCIFLPSLTSSPLLLLTVASVSWQRCNSLLQVCVCKYKHFSFYVNKNTAMPHFSLDYSLAIVPYQYT